MNRDLNFIYLVLFLAIVNVEFVMLSCNCFLLSLLFLLFFYKAATDSVHEAVDDPVPDLHNNNLPTLNNTDDETARQELVSPRAQSAKHTDTQHKHKSHESTQRPRSWTGGRSRSSLPRSRSVMSEPARFSGRRRAFDLCPLPDDLLSRRRPISGAFERAPERSLLTPDIGTEDNTHQDLEKTTLNEEPEVIGVEKAAKAPSVKSSVRSAKPDLEAEDDYDEDALDDVFEPLPEDINHQVNEELGRTVENIEAEGGTATSIEAEGGTEENIEEDKEGDNAHCVLHSHSMHQCYPDLHQCNPQSASFFSRIPMIYNTACSITFMQHVVYT
jgi:hypothetical protein